MRKIPFFISLLIFLSMLISFSFAEDKPDSSYIVPEKLTPEEMEGGPTLSESHVYPGWGQACTNFTYRVIYTDEEGREPEYMRIRLNNEWYDMNKQSGTPETGELYTYNYIPNSGKSNFYYFEASNGIGKARDGIIDSPDQGPMIYSEKFDNNEIILLDKEGNELWTYPTGYDAVADVAISKNGEYAAAVTTTTIYLFSVESGELLWKFCKNCEELSISTANYQGVAISENGDYIAGSVNGKLYFFEKDSNESLWNKDIESNPIGIDMSDDGEYIAAGIANAGANGDKIFFFNKEGEKLWEYKAEHPDYIQTGNFYRPDMTPDGEYVAVSTGCPDRRAYLFDKSGELIFRTEMLTEDSPVHKSAISDSGNLIAYSLDHMQGKPILYLFNKEGNVVWSFSSSEDGTARAVSISSDGTYIAIGTSVGHIYLFNKNSNIPLWKYTAYGTSTGFSSIGDVKLSSNGDFLVAVGTPKKVYFFEKESNEPLWIYNANTWVDSVDFNDEYIIAGTGLMEYLFEGNDVSTDEVVCKEIIQPPPMQETMYYDDGGIEGTAECGNSKCEPDFGETHETCPLDCMSNNDMDPDDLNGLGDEDICENGICEDDFNGEVFCGNGLCDKPSEDYINCPQDCPEPEEDLDVLDNQTGEADDGEDLIGGEAEVEEQDDFVFLIGAGVLIIVILIIGWKFLFKKGKK